MQWKVEADSCWYSQSRGSLVDVSLHLYSSIVTHFGVTGRGSAQGSFWVALVAQRIRGVTRLKKLRYVKDSSVARVTSRQVCHQRPALLKGLVVARVKSGTRAQPSKGFETKKQLKVQRNAIRIQREFDTTSTSKGERGDVKCGTAATETKEWVRIKWIQVDEKNEDTVTTGHRMAVCKRVNGEPGPNVW